jgi:uncharacterized protein (TIGR02453 family)
MNIIPFLRELSQNNHREWFETHRKEYELAKTELLELVSGLIGEIATFDQTIQHLDPKKCIFRINRDVRFSKDKSPYKQYMSAFFSKDGKSSQFGGYYIHFEPENCFVGGGVYSPPPEVQQAIRREIYFNSTEFVDIIERESFKKTFGTLQYDKYFRVPKGFPADFEFGELLKYKHYVASCPLPDNIVQNSDIQQFAVGIFKKLYPLNQFLNCAIMNS